jgi:type II restriction enzyme
VNLFFNTSIAKEYKSNSQIARVLTEDWVSKNSYCPSCGNFSLNVYKRNNPAADFFCQQCSADYELKSFKTLPKFRIVDGAYNSMVNKIKLNKNPNFLFLHYDTSYSVINYFSIPRYFFTLEIIEKRNPLSPNARRANWIGCNIRYGNLPKAGVIYLVKERNIISPEIVFKQWQKTSFLNNQKLLNRGWTIELLGLIENISSDIFSIQEVYKFEHVLRQKFPHNKFVKEKIRQQLQVLRDRGVIKFRGKGIYQKGELNGGREF